MKYKEGDTVYLKRDKAVISQLYKSTTGEEGYILVKNDDNNHLYFAKEDEVELIEPDHFADVGKMEDKIEELDVKTLSNIFIANDNFNKMVAFSTTLHKLNEVIRYINRRTENE